MIYANRKLKEYENNLAFVDISEEILRALPETLSPEFEKSFEERLAEYSKKLGGCLNVILKDVRRLQSGS